ncbi:hypothetical protein KIL84_020598 [Mauremys mutica]|uniref:Uncharacterized protein n=1 Tax=Mauremys mutica TaxID=74926 RepID=A0A9D3XVY4_9SAUR|nr:hypothetical protein KIL84_020598 [Mauremys mutica]
MAGKSFEEKIANVLAYLRNTTYPEGMNKADRVNLRQFAVNFSLEEPPTLAAESTAEENIRTEIAVGDTEPETPSEETGKMVGTVSHKSPESTVNTIEVRAVEEEDVSSNDTIDDDDDDVLMEDGGDRQWFLEGY